MKLLPFLALLLLVVSFENLTNLAQTDDDVISVDTSIVVLNASITDASGKDRRPLHLNARRSRNA
jgi:hypothetical protein